MDFPNSSQLSFIGLFAAWKAFDHVFDPVHQSFINILTYFTGLVT